MERREYGQSDLEKEFKEYKLRQDEITQRAASLNIIHEDSLVVQRLDINKFYTPLTSDPAGDKIRKHESWYARVLFISPIFCGDDIRENKKKLVKINDVIIYNSEVPYSLNIKGFEYDIYVMHVNNIICIDRQFDCDKMFMDNLIKKLGTTIY